MSKAEAIDVDAFLAEEEEAQLFAAIEKDGLIPNEENSSSSEMRDITEERLLDNGPDLDENVLVQSALRLQTILNGTDYLGRTSAEQRAKMSKDDLIQRNLEIQGLHALLFFSNFLVFRHRCVDVVSPRLSNVRSSSSSSLFPSFS